MDHSCSVRWSQTLTIPLDSVADLKLQESQAEAEEIVIQMPAALLRLQADSFHWTHSLAPLGKVWCAIESDVSKKGMGHAGQLTKKYFQIYEWPLKGASYKLALKTAKATVAILM